MLSTLAAKLLTIATASNVGVSPDVSAPDRDCVVLLAPVDGPDSPASRRVRLLELSADAEKLLRKGQWKEAAEVLGRCAALAEALAADAPDDREVQRDLHLTLGHLGRSLEQSDRAKEAAEVYARSLRIAEKLVATDPKDMRARLDLLNEYHWAGGREWNRRRPDAAIRYYRKAVDIGSVADAPKELVLQATAMRHAILETRATVAVIEDPDSVGEFGESYRAAALTQSFPVIVEKKELVKARKVAELLAEKGKWTGDFYEAARMFSELAAIGDGDQKERDALRAVDMLRIAVCDGLWNARSLREDLDLAALQDRADFRAILADLERTARRK